MKLTVLLLTVAMLQVHAECVAQSITFSGKEVSLKKVFAAIKKQTGYVVFYNQDLLENTKPLSLTVYNMPLKAFLDIAFKEQPLNFRIDGENIFLSRKSQGASPSLPAIFSDQPPRDFSVRGVVRDTTGAPLAGASVKIKGTQTGTTTNAKGEFTISANSGDILIITFVSFESQEIQVRDGNIFVMIFVMMRASDSPLDEVQVIAYGNTTRRLNTGSVSTVKSNDIARQPVNNPMYALQGRVPGVIITPTSGLPGSPVSVQIRGRNTLNPSNMSEPLYIVDGLPYGNNLPIGGGSITSGLGALGTAFSPFNVINPNDIESIDILKDADATSIYGSRGSNGVILITTKKGKAGKTKVDINVQSGFSQVAKKLKLLNTQQYIEMRREGLKNDNQLSRLDQPDIYAEIYPDLLLWDQARNTDWQETFIGGTAKYTDVQGSISGGTPFIQYIVGGTYHRETTVFPGSNDDTKVSGHFNMTGTSQNQRLHTALSASYVSNAGNLPGIDLTELSVRLPSNAPSLYLPDGALNWEPGPYSGATTWSLAAGENPLASLARSYEIKQSNLLTSAEVSYSLFAGLNLKTVVGYSETRGNSFQQGPSTTFDPAYVDIAGDGARFAVFNEITIRNFNFNPQVTFNKSLGIGSFKFLAGADFQSTNTDVLSISASGFASDALLKNLQAAQLYNPGSNSLQYKYNAIFTRLTFNSSNNKYTINLNARRDGSSRFSPGRQFGNFGSVGAAYIFSEENMVKSWFPALSFGKIRMSYGSSGNDGNADYMYLEQYYATAGSGQVLYQGVGGYRTMGLYNDEYGWETTRKMEIGLDIGFWKDRLLFQSSFYRNRSDDQLVNYAYPSMAGFGNVLVNFPALIQNTGFEFVLDASLIKHQNFNWRSSLNLTISRNKLIDFPGLEISPYSRQFEIGEPFTGLVYAFNYTGTDPATGVYQFADTEGKLTTDPTTIDRLDNGRYLRIMTAPKYYGGLQNNITWGGISLDFLLQFAKQMGVNPDYQWFSAPGTGLFNRTTEVLQRWQKPGDASPVQRFTSSDFTYGLRTSIERARQSDMGYVDASFIRFKNVSLSYNIPKNMLNRLRMQLVRVYIQGQNLYTITKYKGFDPESQNIGFLPPLRTVTFGIQITL